MASWLTAEEAGIAIAEFKDLPHKELDLVYNFFTRRFASFYVASF